MRYYIIINNIRTTSIDSLMNHCDGFPLLLKIKRMLLHDKDTAVKEIEYYIQQLYDNKFHFLYNIKGMYSDWSTVWPEDLAKSAWDRRDMIVMLKDLKTWILLQPDYRYPAEING